MATVMLKKKRKRPVTLVILCLLLFVQAVGFGLVALVLTLDEQLPAGAALLPRLGYEAMVIWLFLSALLFLIAAIGVWLLRPFAWRLTMILTGARMMIDLWVYFSGNPSNHLSMLFSIFTVFYLVQMDVRSLFGAGNNRQGNR